MQSYNNLWEQIITPKNVAYAIRKASKGKRKRKRVRYYLEDIKSCNQLSECKTIQFFIKLANTYIRHRKEPIEIYDGVSRKKRKIIVPTFEEQVIHHMIMIGIQPIIMKGMYKYALGSIPGRGVHSGAKRIKKWIKYGGKDVKYYLKMDIRHFFDSIPHDKLFKFISDRIHDPQLMRLIIEVINCNDCGVPLGYHTSHWFAHWYLQRLDYFIKQELNAVYYIRYVDDMVIFGSNKKELHKMRENISDFLGKLGLELKSNWQVVRFDYINKKTGKRSGRDLDFMGFRFFRDKIIIRKSIMYKMTRKAKRIGKKDKPSIYECKQMMSYLGWINSTDSYAMYEKWVKPYVNFRKMKKRISNYDKKQNKKEKEAAIKSCGEALKTAIQQNQQR